MNELIFLTGKWLSPSYRIKSKIPLAFISFALIKGQMYKMREPEETFITQEGKTWGNSVLYGGIFLLKDADYHLRTLDVFHLCSMRTLRVNHVLDMSHYVDVNVTPITFNTVDEFSRLLYREKEPMSLPTYIANLNHPKITERLRIKNKNTNRIQHGFLKQAMLEQIKEVCT